MMDRIEGVCVRCNAGFVVWANRGEIMPALCLRCYWIDLEDRAEIAALEEHKRGRTPFPDDVVGSDKTGPDDADGPVIDVKEV